MRRAPTPARFNRTQAERLRQHAADQRAEEDAQFTAIRHMTDEALASRLTLLVEDPHTFRRAFRDSMLIEAARRLTAKEGR